MAEQIKQPTELELIVKAISELGEAGKDAFLAYLATDIFGDLIVAGVIVLIVFLGYKLSLKQMNYEHNKRNK